MQKFICTGNLVRECELQTSGGGNSYMNNAIAINGRRKSGDSYEDTVTFIDFVVFGRQAEVLQEYSGKGKKVLLEGSFETNSWEDKETGEKRSRLQLIAHSIELLSAKSDDEPVEKKSKPKKKAAPVPVPDDDDDIPF